MSWIERFKLTIHIFKKSALALYLWYFIFFLATVLSALLLFLLPIGNRLLDFVDNLSSPYALDPFDSTMFLEYLPAFLVLFILFSIIGIVATGLLYTGTYHLALKAMEGKASFKDFRFTGAPRMTGWYFFLFIIYFGLFILGAALYFFVSTISNTSSTVYLVIGLGIFILGSIFILPWMFSASYYMIAHLEQSFSLALKNSWRFFRTNMGALWGGVFALFLINIGIGLIQEISQSIGGILSLLATPFLSLIPIIWTVSLMQDSQDLSLYVHANEYENNNNESHNPEDFRQDYSYGDYEQTNQKPDDEQLQTYTQPFPKPYDEISVRIPKQSDLSEVSNAEMNYCSNCGSLIRVNSIYCSKCGVKLH